MMYSAHKLNKQSDNIQLWHTPFPILNQSIVPCPDYFLSCTQSFQGAGKVVWYFLLLKNFPQFVVIHTVKDSMIVNESEVDFLKFPCSFYDPVNVGNLISGSSAFS